MNENTLTILFKYFNMVELSNSKKTIPPPNTTTNIVSPQISNITITFIIQLTLIGGEIKSYPVTLDNQLDFAFFRKVRYFFVLVAINTSSHSKKQFDIIPIK